MTLSEGNKLQNGKYVIESVLGQGGFGNTYRTCHTEFDDIVAVKEFFMKGVTERDETTLAISVSNSANQKQFDEQKEKFKKEACRLRKLNNKHIVKVHDLFEENGTAYYVMDYIDGESLSARLKRTGKSLSEPEVKSLLLQVLDALAEVHSKNIWHLDIKPGNIMINADSDVWLIDFGASKQIHSDGNMTTSTALCYTPGYAPNEQVAQMYNLFGPWTDLYALGATLYNVITQNKPPQSVEIEEKGRAAFSFDSDVSAEMQDLIVWLMQPKRTDRPQSVADVLMRLNDAPSDDNDDTVILDGSKKKTEGKKKLKDDNIDDSEETVIYDDNKKHDKVQPDDSGKVKKNNSQKKSRSNSWVRKVFMGIAVCVISLFAIGFAFWYSSQPARLDSDDISVTGTIDGHSYVDLGLSVNWATCNVGADYMWGGGDHFAWGETSPKSEYTESNCLTMFKDIGNDISGNPKYDAARHNWGGNWRMPTKAECDELEKQCTWRKANLDGFNGFLVTGPNGNSIFLPAAGLMGKETEGVGLFGVYWTSTTGNSESNNTGACFDFLYMDGMSYNNGRENGFSIRAVINK